jgi:hypothetical protein
MEVSRHPPAIAKAPQDRLLHFNHGLALEAGVMAMITGVGLATG